MRRIIHMTDEQFEKVRSHLFSSEVESCAFAYATVDDEGLHVTAVELVQDSEDIEVQTAFQLVVSTDRLDAVIERAAKTKSAIIEFHSHLSPRDAMFSMTDTDGLSETAPNARWRNQRRPYAAIVLHEGSADGLLWAEEDMLQVEALKIDDKTIEMTGLTLTPESYE